MLSSLELYKLIAYSSESNKVVGSNGVEPFTSSLSVTRSTDELTALAAFGQFVRAYGTEGFTLALCADLTAKPIRSILTLSKLSFQIKR